MARILVMDDHKVLCAVIERALSTKHEVHLALDGKVGLEKFAERPADLVVVDINMPDVNGMEVISELRKAEPDLPIIAMSGDSRFPAATNLQLASKIGASAIIEKPFTMDELKQLVDQLLQP